MQRFFCEHCGNEVEFETSACPVCATQLGYVPDERTLRRLVPSGDGVSYALVGDVTEYWRCLERGVGMQLGARGGDGGDVVPVVRSDAWPSR